MIEDKELLSIQQMIYKFRGKKVMLDSDLANLYGVQTKNLNRAVKRNIEKFPPEFMFQLTKNEFDELVPNWHQFDKAKHRASLPYAFAEHGVLMTAIILNSEKANTISIVKVKIFIKMRDYALSQKETNLRVAELREILLLHIESNDTKFSEYSNAIDSILEALYNLNSQTNEKNKIGFDTENTKP